MKTFIFVGLLAVTWGCPQKSSAQSDATSEWDLYQKASEENPYDVTFKVTNAACSGSTGWSRHNSDAAAGYNKYNTEFNSNVYSGVGIETWYWSPQTNADLIWQDVSGLMPGRYRVTAMAVGQVYNDASHKGENVGDLYFFANDSRVSVTSNKWQEVETVCELEAGSVLRIGIAAGADNANDWASIAQVKVYCIGLGEPEKIALNEWYDVCAVTADTYADVYLSKMFPEYGYTWLCVPFDMNEEQIAACFSEVKEPVAATLNGEELGLTFDTATTIEAGKPYWIKAKDAGQSLTIIEKAWIQSASPLTISLGNGICITGTYHRTEGIAGAYLLDEDEEHLIQADEYSKCKGFSAYLSIDETSAQTIKLNTDPMDVTSIDAATILPQVERTDVYSLSGILVKRNASPQSALEGLGKGIYIIGNHKIIKK